MNRIDWGEIVGDGHEIVDDLRWELFQAERSIETMRRGEGKTDAVLYDLNMRRVTDAKYTLAALWTRKWRLT